MTRRGWRRMDSMAITTFGIGARSSEPASSGDRGGWLAGTPARAGAGISGGVLGSFISVEWVCVGSGREQMTDSAKNCLVEVAFKGVRTEELNRQSRRADERTQNPAELATEKQIARKP